MKKGDTLQCRDEKDLVRMMDILREAGFDAVRDTHDGLQLVITEVPETQYLTQAHDQNGRCQRAYCDTLEEAEEIAAEYGNGYEFVEILKGYNGEWELISQSW